jgi:hypothetical protein
LMRVQLTNQSPLASRMTPLLVLGRSLVPSLLLFFGQCQSCYRFCPFGWPKSGGWFLLLSAAVEHLIATIFSCVTVLDQQTSYGP